MNDYGRGCNGQKKVRGRAAIWEVFSINSNYTVYMTERGEDGGGRAEGETAPLSHYWR